MIYYLFILNVLFNLSGTLAVAGSKYTIGIFDSAGQVSIYYIYSQEASNISGHMI